MKGKTAISGLLAMGIVIGLATLGLVYGNWTQSLQIGGDITTSGLDAQLDFKGAFDADGDTGPKNVGTCRGGTDAGEKSAEIVIENAYPNYWCEASYSVTNTGQMPIRVWPKNAGGSLHPSIDVFLDCPEVQLLPGERSECIALITFGKGAVELPEKATFDFGSKINVTQFDKAPDKSDTIIDADGIATRFSGVGTLAVDAKNGDTISFFPDAGTTAEGLDWFDTDGSGTYTAGDDFHLEDSSGACTTGTRDGVHRLGQDCKLLDTDDSLAEGDPVACDMEGLGAFIVCDSLIGWIDSNGNGDYDNGEDIVYDANGNGIYD